MRGEQGLPFCISVMAARLMPAALLTATVVPVEELEINQTTELQLEHRPCVRLTTGCGGSHALVHFVVRSEVDFLLRLGFGVLGLAASCRDIQTELAAQLEADGPSILGGHVPRIIVVIARDIAGQK